MGILCFAALALALFFAGCVRAFLGKGKRLLVLGGVLTLFVLASFGAFVYVTEYQPHEVASYASGDSAHRLVIKQIGDPGFPFGDAKCRVVLTDGERQIGKAEVMIPNDGASARPDNFTVSWMADRVCVVARGDESIGDASIVLLFDADTP